MRLIALTALIAGLSPAYALAQDAAAGAKVFNKCKACHDIGETAKNRMGPVLTGVVGRVAGTAPDYKYSTAMHDAGAAGLVWTAETIDTFITSPKDLVPGTKMSFALTDAQQRADVIAYLATFSQGSETAGPASGETSAADASGSGAAGDASASSSASSSSAPAASDATASSADTASGNASGAGAVLTGEAAFGNWQKDAPGVVRQLKPEDMPAAGATPSASNAPGTVPRPEGAMPKVPDGFSIELVASGIENPRAIRFAPNGDLFIANSGAGNVLVLHFEGDAAKPASQTVFAAGLNQPYGIAFYPADNPQWVYVAESDGLRRFAYTAGDTKASAEPETLFKNIPPEHHWTRDIVFLPGTETLLYSVGSGSNVGEGTMEREPKGGTQAWASSHPLGVSWGEEERRADVLAFDVNGKNERYFATGLRNCAGMTIQPATGLPWCVVNNVDELGDNVPFEYATSMKEGQFFGWPWYYIGNHPDPRWTDNPRPDLADKVTVPDVLFQAHSAPLNIAFDPSDAWGADYKGDAFVALHGSWNRGQRTGYKVVRLDFDENGKPKGTYEDFVTGFVVDAENVWGRPVGVAVSKDGALYISEDGSGTIWRVHKQ